MQVASSWISSTNLEEVVCTSTQCDSINTDIIFHEPDGNVLAEVPIRMEISITFLNHCSINHANILCNARNIEIYINDQYSETIRGDLQSNNIYSYSIQFKHSPTTELRLRFLSLPKRSKNSPLTFILYNKIFIKVNECPSNNLHHENLSSNYKPITNNLSNELISSLVQNLSLSSSSKTVNSIQIDENIKSYIDEQINIKFKSIEERILSIEAALKK